MKKVLLLLGLMMAILSAPSYAQNHDRCGVTYEQGLVIKQRMLDNRKANPNFVRTRGVTKYVPLKIHLVGKDDGTDYARVEDALDMLCVLNEEWESLDIQFYLVGDISYFNNTTVFNHVNFDTPVGSAVVWNQANAQKVNNAINVFVTSNVGGSNSIGTTLAYFTPLIDCVFVRKASMLQRSVLPHEMGHFFSLGHPFLGWEDNPWDEATHGLQVTLYNPSGGVNEKVNGTNCGFAADGICDTPPDYLFGFHPDQNGCNPFTQGTLDPNGELIDPLENNTMSYFGGCSPYLFTEGQMDAAHDDLINNPARNYVDTDYIPNQDDVDEFTTLVAPIDDEERPFNSVTLEWTAVPGATHYLLEVDRVTSFDWNPYVKVISAANVHALVDFCDPNKTYYWRVRPFNEYSTCDSGFTSHETFTTNAISSKVENVDGLDNWNLRPNPANGSEVVFLDVETTTAIETSVNLYNVTGKLMTSVTSRLAEGTNTIELATGDLASGLYMVSIQTEGGVSTKRLVIR